MLVSYLPFRLAQKHYFQSCRKRRGVTRGGPTHQYGVYFNQVRGTRNVRVIGSDCNCCVSLQITVHRSLSSPNSQPVSDPPFPFLVLLFPVAVIRDSVMYAQTSLLATEIQCCVSAQYVNVPLVELHHPVDPVRATAADNDIALSASECTRSSPQTQLYGFYVGR